MSELQDFSPVVASELMGRNRKKSSFPSYYCASCLHKLKTLWQGVVFYAVAGSTMDFDHLLGPLVLHRFKN